MATIKSGYSGKLAGFPLLGPRRKHDKRTDVQEVNFESLFGSDEFQVGTQIVGSGDVDGFDRFDPTNDGANPGISLAANTPLVFQATNGSIGLEQILLHVKEPTAAVPEPKWPSRCCLRLESEIGIELRSRKIALLYKPYRLF